MISEQAKQGIDHIFARSSRKSLVLNPGDTCDIRPLSGSVLPKPDEKETAIILTISSFLFKVLTIFHIEENETTRRYFLGKSEGRSLPEVFAELGNLCSGAMNHELLRHFPHLGMSIPYMLDGKSMAFLQELNPGHLSLHNITINGSACLRATVCMCGYAPVDFCVDMNDAADNSGELELF